MLPPAEYVRRHLLIEQDDNDFLFYLDQHPVCYATGSQELCTAYAEKLRKALTHLIQNYVRELLLDGLKDCPVSEHDLKRIVQLRDNWLLTPSILKSDAFHAVDSLGAIVQYLQTRLAFLENELQNEHLYANGYQAGIADGKRLAREELTPRR